MVERLFDLLMLFALFAWVFYYHAEVFETDTNVKGIAIADLATVFGRLSGSSHRCRRSGTTRWNT